jgi:hypothetical protein
MDAHPTLSRRRDRWCPDCCGDVRCDDRHSPLLLASRVSPIEVLGGEVRCGLTCVRGVVVFLAA